MQIKCSYQWPLDEAKWMNFGIFAPYLPHSSFQNYQFVLHFAQAVAWNFVFWMHLLSGSHCIFVYVIFNFFFHQREIVFQNGMDSFVGPEEQWGKYWLSPALLIFMTSIIKVLGFSEMGSLEQNLPFFFF